MLSMLAMRVMMGLFSLSNTTKGQVFVMLTGSQGRRRARTVEQREAYNRYQREYRQRNPERVQRWQREYIMRKAARLAAEQTQAAAHMGGE